MRDFRRRCRWLFLGLLLVLVGLGQGCRLDIVFAPCQTSQDCKGGQICFGGYCSDNTSTPGPITPPGPDTPPSPRACGTGCQTAEDCERCKADGTTGSLRCFEGACVTAIQETGIRVLAKRKAVDILFVIDNSTSMQEEQDKLAKTFEAFIKELTKQEINDFQIGVITTDMFDSSHAGRLVSKDNAPRIIKRSELSAEAVIEAFKSNVNVGNKGSQLERPFDAIRAALSPTLRNGWNKGLLREDAILAIVILSDEDDCSYDPAKLGAPRNVGCRRPSEYPYYGKDGKVIDGPPRPSTGTLEQLTPVQTYIDFLRSLNKEIYITGLIGDPVAYRPNQPKVPITPSWGCNEDAECNSLQNGLRCGFKSTTERVCGGCLNDEGSAFPGIRLFELFKAFGGADDWYTICGNSSAFQRALLRAAAGITRSFDSVQLTKPPLDLDSIQVSIQLPNQEPTPLTQATTTGKACTQSAECDNNGLCAQSQCHGDGWVLQSLSGTYLVSLSGIYREQATKGGRLIVKYTAAQPTAP